MIKIISTAFMKVKQRIRLTNTPTWCVVVFVALMTSVSVAGFVQTMVGHEILIVRKLCSARLVADFNDDGRLTLKQTTQECSDGEPTDYYYAPAD